MPYEFQTKRRVEFADVDLAGFVYFSRFFVYMETAEHEFLRSLGTSVHMKLNGQEVGWPRLAASCEYFSPAKFEDVLDIHLTVLRKGQTSMTYEFEITREDVLVARGQLSSICCIIDPVSGPKSIPIPKFIAEKIEIKPRRHKATKKRTPS